MAAPDPARAPKRTLAEHVKMKQATCRALPCATIEAGRLRCTFCPHIKKLLASEGG